MTTINTGSKLIGYPPKEMGRLRKLLHDRDLPRVTVEIVTEVDPTWILLLCHHKDLLRYCNYWLYVVARDGARGCLVWAPRDRSTGEGSRPSAEAEAAAFDAWVVEGDLPADFYRLDVAAAVSIWKLGVAEWGPSWFADDVDSDRSDVLLQRLLFGEILFD